jgi:hypothetical protein
MAKSNMSSENKKHLRDEISALLGQIGDQNQNELVLDNELANETRAESPYDFEKMSSQFTKKAREITDSLFKNFVDVGVFEQNDYAKHKKELDTINISNLFFQLKTLKITIIKVMEEITSGNTQPRLLEVMGQLQDKFADITKIQANYIIFLEETYQKLNRDKPVNDNDKEINSDSDEGQYFITVGTKNIIKTLPEAPALGKTKPGELVDPTKKATLMKDRNIEIEPEDLPDDYLDITGMI